MFRVTYVEMKELDMNSLEEDDGGGGIVAHMNK
jgi:hypothetical protein